MRSLNLSPDEMRERVRARQARYRERNRDRINERQRAYIAANREAIREKYRADRAARPEYYREKEQRRNQRWGAKDAARRMATYRRRAFGLSPDQFEAMLTAQSGLCAICGSRDSDRQLAVDHDHKTGRVRGLLCSRCNQALGGFGDSAERLRKAADYLDGVSCLS